MSVMHATNLKQTCGKLQAHSRMGILAHAHNVNTHTRANIHAHASMAT